MTAWAAVSLLTLLYICAIIDRGLPAVLLQPLKHRFGLSDLDAGLLLGPAFGILYGIMAFPMGWLADRWGRRRTVALAVLVWSFASMSSAFVQTAGCLIAARCVVAIAEAALSPAAFALIAEVFPANRSALPMSVYATGGPVGFGAAIWLGGALSKYEGSHICLPFLGEIQAWQLAFVLAALPAISLAPFVLLIPEARSRTATVPDERGPGSGLLVFFRIEWRRLGLLLGLFGVMSVVAVSIQIWSAPFAQRTYGAGATKPLAIAVLMAGLFGNVVVGRIATYLRANRHGQVYIWLAVGLSAAALPIAALAFSSFALSVFVVGMAITVFLLFPFIGYAGAAFNEFTPPPLRARVSALFFTVVAMAGSVIGPPLVGGLTDALGGEARLGAAMVMLIAAGGLSIAGIAVFSIAHRHSGKIGPHTPAASEDLD